MSMQYSDRVIVFSSDAVSEPIAVAELTVDRLGQIDRREVWRSAPRTLGQLISNSMSNSCVISPLTDV
jgi:hypothetical protein